MAEILLGMTQKQWEELDCIIDSVSVFEDILSDFTQEAKDDFRAYVSDMIGMGLDEDDDGEEWRIDQLGESLDTLKKLAKMDFAQKLAFAPDLICSLLQGYIIGQVDECKCIVDKDKKKDD